MESLKDLVNQMLIKNIAKSIYYRTIKRSLLQTFKLYRSSDEEDKFKHIMESLNYLRIAGDGGELLPQTYFEFGCHSGRTFSSAINSTKFLKMKNAKYFAFDSFEGLPDTTEADGYFEVGTFCTSEDTFKKIVMANTNVRLNHDSIITGFYEKSLITEHAQSLPQIGVVHIDVDLYSSTVSVLKYCKDRLVSGSVLLFDDYYCYNPDKPSGELRALNEFLGANKEFGVIPWKAYSTFGQSFFVKKL